MKKHQPRHHSLIALSTTALALPGIACADSPPLQSTLSYKFSNYQEDDLPRREAPFGERQRYDIDIHQLRLVTPSGSNTSLQIDASHESMSGASPWFTTADSNGEPQVNLSGASGLGISDIRNELAFSGSYYFNSGTLGASIGRSEEDDYRSSYAGFSAQRNFNREMTTVAVSFSYAEDDIFPSDAELFNRVLDEQKTVRSIALSVSQIINQVTTFQTAITTTDQSGFLSDPYKLRDIRPDEKNQLAWSNSLRRYFIGADAALQLNYRTYHDDFGISSHTLDAAWHQNLGNTFQVIPHFRYYTQSAADFYTSIDDFSLPTSNSQSSDYRLSSYGAISGGINFVADFGDWALSFNSERYIANHKYSAYDVSQPGAGLVQFFRYSLGVDFTF